jgi:hypothetical protein
MAIRWHGLSQSLTQTGVRQPEIVRDLEQDQLVTQPIFALTRRGAAPSHRRDPLTQAQIEPLHKGRVDLPAAGRQHLLDSRFCAKHHAVCDRDDLPPSQGLHDLRIE